jgi:alpha-1,2-mannosyltransferase
VVLLLLASAALVMMHAAVIAQRRARPGDFDVSREFGRRFVAGEPLYAGGLHYPYMPAAALYFSPLALLPPWAGLALRYAVALACLALTLRILGRLVYARYPALAREPVVVATVTLVLGAHYLVRDLDDGGPHVILLALIVYGLSLAASRREGGAALCFGLAGAAKAPALLLLPFLLWKRRWRLFALTALATAAWTALPAAWMGLPSWWQHQRQWSRYAFASALGQPLPGAAESEGRIQNQGLIPVVARLTDGRDRPGEAAAGGRRALAWLAAAALVSLFAWRTRSRDEAAWLLDAAAALLLMALLSPVVWVQHLVVALPALYLIAAEGRATTAEGRASTAEGRAICPLGRPWAAVMGLYAVLSLLLNREVLGRDVYLLLLGAGLHTVCMLLLLTVLLFRRPTVAGSRP